MQLTDLRIPLATRMHLTIVGTDYKPHLCPAELLGYRPGFSVLAYLPKKPPGQLQTDAKVSVRIGLQSAIIRFESTIKQFHEQPYAYLHISYPASVTIEKQLRSSPRFAFEVPITATLPGDVDSVAKPISGHILDISLNGARLSFKQELPAGTKKITLHSSIFVAGSEQQLELVVQVKSTPEPKDIAVTQQLIYGVSFTETTAQQLLVLQALCYELQA